MDKDKNQTGWQRVKDHLMQNLFNYGFTTQQSGQEANYNPIKMASVAFGPTQSLAADEGVDNSGWASSQTNTVGDYSSFLDKDKNKDKTKTNTSSTSGTVKVGTDETEEEKKKREREATIRAQQAIAKSKYDEGLRRAADYLKNAQTYTNQMKGIIGNKRGEFENMFDEARGQIGTSAGQRIGEAGRASESLATSVGNRARALGLTGTTAQSMMNRPQDALARDIFNINQQRTSNDNENRRLLGERQDWATGQEAELDQYLRNVANEAQSMKNTSYLDYWDNLSNLDQKLDNYLGSMIKAQNQAALMAPSIQGYDTSAMSPTFANTMNSLQGLQSGINSMYLNQTPTAGDDAATLVGEDDMQKLLKRFI